MRCGSARCIRSDRFLTALIVSPLLHARIGDVESAIGYRTRPVRVADHRNWMHVELRSFLSYRKGDPDREETQQRLTGPALIGRFAEDGLCGAINLCADGFAADKLLRLFRQNLDHDG